MSIRGVDLRNGIVLYSVVGCTEGVSDSLVWGVSGGGDKGGLTIGGVGGFTVPSVAFGRGGGVT